MPKDGWKKNWGVITILVVAIAGTWIIASIGQPRSPIMSKYSVEDPRADDFIPGGDACSPKTFAEQSDKTRQSELRRRCAEAAEAHRLTANDLIQQTRAADAAQAQVRLGYDVAWLAYVQTIGGFLTLLAAVAAAVGARQAAQAARETIDHSRQTSSIELRPYLDFSDVRIHDRNGAKEVIVNIENFGKTPATVTSMEHGYVVVPAVGKFALPTIRDSRFDPRSVAPGHKIESRHRRILIVKNVSRVIKAECRLVFRMKITYTDFGNTLEDCLERSWLITKDHVPGDRTLTRVHVKRHLLDAD